MVPGGQGQSESKGLGLPTAAVMHSCSQTDERSSREIGVEIQRPANANHSCTS